MRATKVIDGKLFYGRLSGSKARCKKEGARLKTIGRKVSVRRVGKRHILFVQRHGRR